jgi:hypothetical protein
LYREIIDLLASNPQQVEYVGSQNEANSDQTRLYITERNHTYEESVGEEDDNNEWLERQPFEKPIDMLSSWVNDVGISAQETEESGSFIEDNHVHQDLDQVMHISPATVDARDLFQLTDYENFIRQSDAYQWLLSKITQHGQLAFEDPNLMFDIGARIRNELWAQESLRRISRQRPPSLVRMIFNFDWNPKQYISDQGFDSSFSGVLDKVLCLTGSWDQAQIVTVTKYISQTWPLTAEPITSLVQELISLPEGQECSREF